jgi:hypothetical protein
MMIDLTRDLMLGIAAIPFIYYALALASSFLYFLAARRKPTERGSFHPPDQQL